MDRERAPTLLYSSNTAQPMVWIAAQVSARNLPTTGALNATLLLPSNTLTRSWSWSPECATAAGCRIVFPVNADSLNLPTGVYNYTLQVRIGSGSPPMGQQTGKFVVVNDKQSAFGAGWWIEGVERLIALSGTSLLWLGGDGSSRVYVQRNTVVYTAESDVARPDTLTKVSTEYHRRLRNGGRVVFNAALQHIATTNRQGHTTTFAYDGLGRVSTVTLPQPSAIATVRQFVFAYGASGTQDTIRTIAPDGSWRRTIRYHDASRRITAIQETVGSLSADQKTKITAILEKSMKDMQAIPQEERREKGREVMMAANKEVRAVLTAEQQAKFDAMPQGGKGGGEKGGGKKKN